MEAFARVIIEDALINERTNQRRLYSAAVRMGNDSEAQIIWDRIQELNAQIKSIKESEDNTMENKTIKELKEIAKELHVKNWWALNKAKLIEEIEKINNMSEEEKQAAEEQREKENKLFEHYQKNWMKYGPKNDWVKFLKDYNAGKITLIEEVEEVEEDTAEPTEMAAEAQISQSEEVSEKPKRKAKGENKRTNLKLTELTYKGETKSIREWAEELNMPWPTLYDRVNRNGWSVEDAIEIPLGKRRSK